MNSTNRAANRILIVTVGLVLLGVGFIAAAVGSIPAVRDAWKSVAPEVARTARAAALPTAPSATGVNLVGIAIATVLAILIVLLIIFIFRQGQGHTSRLLRNTPTERSTTIVEAAVAEHIVQDALADQDELLSTRVSTYRVRRTSVLKISVVARRGVSPRDIATTIDSALQRLDTVLGAQIPALIHISGGLRARVTKAARPS